MLIFIMITICVLRIIRLFMYIHITITLSHARIPIINTFLIQTKPICVILPVEWVKFLTTKKVKLPYCKILIYNYYN